MSSALASSQAGSSATPFVASGQGKACHSCLYWLTSLGCCRSDSANFRIQEPVDSCGDWKRATREAVIPHVTFSRSPWVDTLRRAD